MFCCGVAVLATIACALRVGAEHHRDVESWFITLKEY